MARPASHHIGALGEAGALPILEHSPPIGFVSLFGVSVVDGILMKTYFVACEEI
jgi:hypothetical protein